MEKTKEIQKRKNNVRRFMMYKMLSWDLLFYYSILFLFLTVVKGFSASQVMIADSFYIFIKLIGQVPSTALIDKIGKRRSLIFANMCVAISILLLIVSKNMLYVLISNAVMAIGFVIKGTCESNMLYDSIPRNRRRGKLFATIDGKATSYYYYIDAITACICGFLFVINGYLPLILCLIITIISTGLSFKFEEIDNVKLKKNGRGIKEHAKDLRYSFKYMTKKKRLRSLLLFYAIFSAILTTIINLRSSLLQELNVPEQYFGVIFAVLGLISGFCANMQEVVHKKYRNKTLVVLSVPVVISCIVIGLLPNLNIEYKLTIGIILLLFAVQYASRGPFNVIINRYLNNFSTKEVRAKIGALKYLLYSVVSIGFSLLSALILKFTNTANTFIIIGCISTIAVVLLLDYMRDRVGLKPEEYPKEEIEYKMVK